MRLPERTLIVFGMEWRACLMTGTGEYTAVPERSMRGKQTVACVAWLFLWELRHAAKAKRSAQRELHILREELRQGNDMLMLSTVSAFDS